MAEQGKQADPRQHKMDLCKSGRPKKLVQAELTNERALLDAMTIEVTAHVQKRTKAETRIENWKHQQKSMNPNDPIDMEDCPFRAIPLDVELVDAHNRQHYIIALLENELEGKVDGGQ